MNNLKKILNVVMRYKTSTAVAIFVLLLAILAIAPAKTNVAKSESCTDAPTVATLNYFPVTWNSVAGYGCTDFAPIAIHNANDSTYAQSATASAGDELYVRIYVHDGAQQGLDAKQTTAYGVNGSVSVSGNTISTNFSASRGDGSATNSVNGSVTVSVPDGASLQIESGSGEFFDYQANQISGSSNLSSTSGTFNMGDMNACFEYSKFFRFKVKVVGGSSVSGNNTISATPGAQLGSQCMRTGTASWTNSSDVTSVEVTVQDLTDNSTVNSLTGTGGAINSTSQTPWLTPAHQYQYIMYNTTGGLHKELARTTENVPDLTCGGGTTVTGNNTIKAVPGAQLGSQCMRTGIVTWSNSSDVTSVEVTVQDTTDNSTVNSVTGTGGAINSTSQTPWLTPTHDYQYIMYNTTGGLHKELARTTETIPNLSCNTTPVTPKVCPSASVSLSPSNITVGDTSNVYAPSGWSEGSFTSSNTSVASFTSGTRSSVLKGLLAGNSQISGSGWTAPNGATNCPLDAATLTVSQGSVNNTYTATASATASATAYTNCSDGTQAKATASATASATATGQTQALAQQAAYDKAYVLAQAQAYAAAQAKAVCSSGGSSTSTSTTVSQNCVNNSCNTTNTTNNSSSSSNSSNSYYSYVYINSSGTVIPSYQSGQLNISKSVRLANSGGSYQNSVTAAAGNVVEYQIILSDTGSSAIGNVRMTDVLPAGLTLVSGSVRVDGSYVTDNVLSSMYVGSLYSGQQKTVVYQATVNNYYSSGSIQNVASATGDNSSSVQDDAWVFMSNGSVQGASVNLTYSKSAFNDTKNQNATAVAASREDFITYTLTATNNGNMPATNFVITDDLSQVLPYADISDYGGGTLSGNVINFPGLTVPAYGSVTRSFKVRVKYSLSSNLSYVMTNSYGNSVSIKINTPLVLGAYIAPKTGADTQAFVFAGMLTAAAAIIRSRKSLLKLLFA